MPTTLAGLAIFVAFLTPGFLNYLQRKRRVPQRTLSPLVEVATFLSISVFTNLLAVGLFAAVRAIAPKHAPNVEQMLSHGTSYIYPRIGYITAWSIGVLIVSCTIAVLIGSDIIPFARLAPVIIDVSAWYQIFESGPKGAKVYVGCDMSDGSYISGYLQWYNTDVDEIADRDLALAAPILVKANDQTVTSDFERMILSARNIERLSVDFVDGFTSESERAQEDGRENGNSEKHG
jgi:hypothetical protein